MKFKRPLRVVVQTGDPKDIAKRAKKQGCRVKEGGSHTVISNNHGRTSIPRHEIKAKGTQSAILRQLTAMGVRALPYALVILGGAAIIAAIFFLPAIMNPEEFQAQINLRLTQVP